jgi:hypothetical protein
MAYADVEKILVSWLDNALAARIVTDVPSNLDLVLPIVQITRIGGRDMFPTLDAAMVDVDVYALTRGEANVLSEEVRTALRFNSRNQVVDGAVIGLVETLLGPTWRPYENTKVRRVGATYRVMVHSTP